MRAFTGVSGSGKSPLVFDTIYTEAQRELISHLPAHRASSRLIHAPPLDAG